MAHVLWAWAPLGCRTAFHRNCSALGRAAQNTRLLLSAVLFMWWIHFLGTLCPKIQLFCVLANPEARMTQSSETSIGRKNQDSEDILSLNCWDQASLWASSYSFTRCSLLIWHENMWTLYLGCSVWWRREFLNLHNSPKKPCWGLMQVGTDCFRHLLAN